MTKTRSIISETIIGKDEPLQPFRSAMIRDTEDVVAPTLTPEFAAMNGRDKWETLVLNGLIGTDEPWIDALTATLRDEASERQSLSDRIDVLEGALKPFAEFADPRQSVPASLRITVGSPMARTQLTMGDCYIARAALHQEGIAP